MITFKNKLVAVMNKSIEPGIAMNALAHMSIGLGTALGKEKLQLDTYIDANGNQYPNISQMPFIILETSGNKIKETAQKAKELNVKYALFINTMTGGNYKEQLERTKLTKEEDLIYYGIVLCGEWETVSTLTKKFSLWR